MRVHREDLVRLPGVGRPAVARVDVAGDSVVKRAKRCVVDTVDLDLDGELGSSCWLSEFEFTVMYFSQCEFWLPL